MSTARSHTPAARHDYERSVARGQVRARGILIVAGGCRPGAGGATALVLREDGRSAAVKGAEVAARAVASGDFAVLDLAVGHVAAQLARRLDQQEDAAGAGMVGRQPAAVRVQGPVA